MRAQRFNARRGDTRLGSIHSAETVMNHMADWRRRRMAICMGRFFWVARTGMARFFRIATNNGALTTLYSFGGTNDGAILTPG